MNWEVGGAHRAAMTDHTKRHANGRGGAGRRTYWNEILENQWLPPELVKQCLRDIEAQGIVLPTEDDNFDNMAKLMPTLIGSLDKRMDVAVGSADGKRMGLLRELLPSGLFPADGSGCILDAFAGTWPESLGLAERGNFGRRVMIQANEPSYALSAIGSDLAQQRKRLHLITPSNLQWNGPDGLSMYKPGYDAIVCMGNGFASQIDPKIQRKSAKTFFDLLRVGGHCVIDERIYGPILTGSFEWSGTHLFFGTDRMTVRPVFAHPKLVVMEYAMKPPPLSNTGDTFDPPPGTGYQSTGGKPLAFYSFQYPFADGELALLLREVGFKIATVRQHGNEFRTYLAVKERAGNSARGSSTP